MPRPNPFVALAERLRSNPEHPPVALTGSPSFLDAGHLWSPREVDALILAIAARRPLLVRGEAGSGKSQIARAAARELGGEHAEPLCQVIHPRFEAYDLIYRFDQLRRLSDAQSKPLKRGSLLHYIEKGPLWHAIDLANDRPDLTPVLLIDEIDKADSDLPNALLEVLGNRSFRLPMLPGTLISAQAERMPLIIISSNEERELPAAFVRRCVVLNLNPPSHEDADDFLSWLESRGAAHAHLQVAPEARSAAAQRVLKDRSEAIGLGQPRVGLAEYIDLLTAVSELTAQEPAKARALRQQEWLQRLAPFALKKGADARQDSEPWPDSASPSK